MIHQTHQPTFEPDHYPDHALRWTNRIRWRNLGNSLGSDVSSRGSDIGYASSPLQVFHVQVNPIVIKISDFATHQWDANSRTICVQRVRVITRMTFRYCNLHLRVLFGFPKTPMSTGNHAHPASATFTHHRNDVMTLTCRIHIQMP